LEKQKTIEFIQIIKRLVTIEGIKETIERIKGET
jgi:hypothetical protein